MDETKKTKPGVRPEQSPATPQRDREFSAFYRAFMPKLVGFLRWQGVPLPDATEVAQETMTEAYRQWASVTTPEAWARRVAGRLWAKRVAEPEDPTGDLPEPNPLLRITDVETWEQRHDVLSLLDRLPSRQRQVLAWSLGGHSPAEIAAELKITPAAARSNLKLARRAIAALRAGGEVTGDGG